MAREGEFQEFLGLRASQQISGREWLAGVLAAQKDRLFLFSPVCLGAGVCGYFGLRTEPSWLMGLPPLLFLLPAIIVLGARRLNSLRHYLGFILLMALFLGCVGFALAKLRTESVASPVLQKSIRVTNIVGRVANIELLEEGDGWRFILKDLKIDRLSPEDTPHSIRLKVRKADQVRPGDIISIKAGLNPPSAPVAPGAFDFQRHSYFKQIGAFGFSYGDPVVLQRAENAFSLGLENVRQKVAARISEVIPAREAGIANALMTGERAAISAQDNQDMRNSGIFHIISISGLHISMIAGVVFFVVRFLMALFPAFALYHPIKKYAAVIALLVTILYMFMVGATVPTVRSVIMTGIILLAVMFDRIPVSMRLVAIAALVIVGLVPETVISASFQMSFMAVAGLVAFYEGTRNFWVEMYRNGGWLRKGFIYLAGICMTTVIASIATAPFSIYHFQQFANYGLLGNLLAVPLTSFIVMPSILLAYILMPFGLDGIALWAVGQGISGMLWVSHFVSQLPHAVWNPPTWPVSVLICFAASGITACLLQGWARLVAVVPVLTGLVFLMAWQAPDILVSASGKMVAIKAPDEQIYVSSRRAERFSTEAWVRLWGQGDEKPLLIRGGPFACDEWGCRYEVWDRHVSLARHAAIHPGECSWADVLVSEDPISKDCQALIKIDVRDLKYKGAHAVWLGDLRVLSVAETRGKRPWTGSYK